MLKDRTKVLLANTLQDMLADAPLSKIRVVDICRRAEVRKQVFYYHFKDKYDLAAWIFDRDYHDVNGSSLFENGPISETLDDIASRSTEMFNRLWAKREFYARLFSEQSQNSIQEYIVQRATEELFGYMKKRHQDVEVSSTMALQLNHYAYGSFNNLADWLTGKVIATPEELVEYELAVMPSFLLATPSS